MRHDLAKYYSCAEADRERSLRRQIRKDWLVNRWSLANQRSQKESQGYKVASFKRQEPLTAKFAKKSREGRKESQINRFKYSTPDGTHFERDS